MGNHHICYINPNAHNNGTNYISTDGHSKWYKLEATLDSNNLMWGKRAYSCPANPPVLRPDGTGPVG